MANGTPAPRVGSQPYNEGDHATELLADIAKLREHRASGVQRRDKSLPWTLINSVFESIEGFIKKSREQPSIKELQIDLHATEKANSMLRKDVTLIKNAIDSLTESLTPASGRGPQARPYAVPSLAKPPTQSPSQSISKNREITIKLNDSNQGSQVRTATREQLIECINRAICNSSNESLTKSQACIRAVKRHPSGDLTLYTESKEHTDSLITHRAEWQSAIGPDARVVVPTYGILVHGISTELDVTNTPDITDRIKRDNPSYQEAQITYTGWLKKDRTGKRASTMVVEFNHPRHANEAILNGIIAGAQLFTCEYYDRACKLKQCLRCQQYGHIGTHCKAMEACSYCAGNHDSRTCEEKGRRPKPEPKCANCKGKHPAWSPHCSTRKAAYLQLETARSNRPYIHQEIAAPSIVQTTSPMSTQASNSSDGTRLLDTGIEAFPMLVPASGLQRTQLPAQAKADQSDGLQATARKRGRPTKKDRQLETQADRLNSDLLLSQAETTENGPASRAPSRLGPNRVGTRAISRNKRQAYEIEDQLTQTTIEPEDSLEEL
jgi:hypothetical protein